MLTLRRNEASFYHYVEDVSYGCSQARLFFAIARKLRVVA